MKIVVVSDTHMPRMNKKLPDRLLRELKTAKAIIHAGDWTNLSVYESLAAFAPVYGVAGNNDGADIIHKFGFRRLIELDGVKMGIVHGHGTGKRIDTEARALEAFKNVSLDVLIYGHSHIPVLKRSAGLLVFNPGSPTDKRKQPLYSFGIFKLASGTVTAKHIYYGDKS
ncbi:metallophosphoesterase [Paenibacillus sp. N4]|uniref:metallophosphoesterase family protein n=1 Tax=Paenibacillus vietnamensis TaxID=2590547 RepID=UPI001CD0AD1A|nr:metallophosphoesterase [Paenibacillus vietnamensis]MCA0754223.1 metallophosphoesterase [Paenibacillus vietnamensis]